MASGQELPKSVPFSCRLAGRFRTQALRIFVLGDAAGIEAQGHQGHRGHGTRQPRAPALARIGKPIFDCWCGAYCACTLASLVC